MDNLKAIEKKLQTIRSMLDDVASKLVVSDIPCRTADIGHIGEALVAISDIQLSIYEQRPDLKPKYLLNPNKNRDKNQDFGRILIQNEHYLGDNKPNEAIDLLKMFKIKNPEGDCIEMANNEISRIERNFNL